jgi:hypothetical protein
MTEPQRDHRSAEAARKVFMELFNILKPYQGLAVLIGGLVPGLEYENAREPHQGTLDVDMLLLRDGTKVPDLARLLKEHGYYQHSRHGELQDYQYLRDVPGYAFPVKVDLLTNRRPGEGLHLIGTHGVLAFPLLGGELASQESHVRSVQGQLPDGEEVQVEAIITGAVPFVVLKAYAIRDRPEPLEKDPYDLYYLVRNYPGGVDTLIKEFEHFLGMPLVQEAGSILDKAFETPSSFGPKSVAQAASFFPGADPDQLSLDASERVLKLARRMREG